MSKNSQTAVGPAKAGAVKSPELVDAINQIFALFRRNYLNQYHKAFGDVEELNHTKRLWLEILARFSPETLLLAARAVIENNEFLPTLHTMISYCEKVGVGTAFPDPHTAYLEACRAPSPKAEFAWSHLAVYYAGRACDWYFLQTQPEAVAFPIYRDKYQDLCSQIRGGLQLQPPAARALEEVIGEPVSKEQGLEKLANLRKQLDL